MHASLARLCLLAATAGLARAQVIHVDDSATGAGDGSSWTDAFPALQDALSAALAGDEIWIATGTYRPDAGVGFVLGDRDATFTLVDGVRMFGGFEGTEGALSERAGLFEATVLSGDLGANDLGDPTTNPVQWSENARHVTFGVNLGPSTVIDGVRISAGFGTAGGVTMFGQAGAMNLVDSSPVLRNVIFERNAAEASGGAMVIERSHPTLEDCTFRDNLTTGSIASGGAIRTFGLDVTRPLFVRCRFERNRSESGGVFGANASRPRFLDCTFVDNFADVGGALRCMTSTTAELVGCVFLGNRATSAAGAILINNAADPWIFQNCTFSGNSSTAAGAVWITGQGAVHFSGCTFAGNSAIDGAGAIWRSAGNAPTRVGDCVLWGNHLVGVFDEAAQLSGVNLAVDYSCVQGLTGALGGAGNIGADPLLVDADGADDVAGTADDDVRLTAGSPCIDAGSAAHLLADVLDLDGDGDVLEATPLDAHLAPRRFDAPLVPDTGGGAAPLPDMGAFEFTGPPLGQTYCSPAVLNSSGGPARIRALGSATLAHDVFVLHCGGLPSAQFGYFLASRTQGLSAMPGGSAGNLCLGGDIGRFLGSLSNSGPLGAFHATIDLASIPVNPPAAVQPGEAWNFQAWFRDGQTSNFSNAATVSFQ